jgi:penicillin-binding protein 2
MDFHSSHTNSSWFVWLFKGILVAFFLVIIGRLIDLQVIKGAYYKSLAEDNRIQRVPILAPRGEIKARNGEVLIDSKKHDESHLSYNSKEIIVPWTRHYAGADFGHITGYLGLAKEGEAGKVRGECPDKGTRKIGSFVGRSGLEEWYDCVLAGFDGEELVEVDAMGERIRSLGRRDPIPGEDIVITVDYGLQKRAAELMREKGAIIALTTKGEVLALYSAPSYDPAIFGEQGKSNDSKSSNSEISKLLTDPNLPLFNRAIGGMFHPGSVYKPLVALAALEEGAITEDYLYEDKGNITIDTNYGNFSYNNWYFTQYGGKEGSINVKKALARSTDTFFYEIGNLLSVDKLTLWSHRFGLDEKTGLDIPGEISGLVPSPEWKLRVKGERWFLGNTYHLAIGQGDLAVTPIALASATNAIANDGDLCKPHLVKNKIDMTSNKTEPKCKDLGIKNENLKIVKEGMEMACATGGTAFPFFDFETPDGGKVACKTGTAETEGGDEGDTHAWFTIFAPIENPEIVLTILVERGGEGSKVAAPIARELMNYWFYEQYGKEIPKKIIPSTTPVAVE